MSNSGESPKSETKSAGVPNHIVYLSSYPLIGEQVDGSMTILQLDFEAEKKLLHNALTEAGKRIRLRKMWATSDNFRLMVTKGMRVLHYTGHGLNNYLAFEDSKGKMHPMTPDNIKNLFKAGNTHGVKLVFVSACHSLRAGHAFVEAGVPHVIAVRLDEQVEDVIARKFARQFYLAAIGGKTVQEAFDIARQSVNYGPNTSRLDIGKKFELLPADGNHDEKLFEDVEDGPWIDNTPNPVPNNLDAIVQHYIGREVKQQEVIRKLHEMRVVVLTGEAGIGKSVIAVAAAHYMTDRRQFVQGAFHLDLHHMKNTPTVTLAGMLVDTVAMVRPDLVDANHGRPPNLLQICHMGEILIVLDGIDDLLHEPQGSPRCVHTFLDKLMRKSQDCKVIITCRDPNFRHVGAFVVQVPPLAPQDGAKLFYDLSPRTIELAHFGCYDPSSARLTLANHPVLTFLGGHPRKIADAVQLLKHGPDPMKTLAAELKERKEEADSLASLSPLLIDLKQHVMIPKSRYWSAEQAWCVAHELDPGPDKSRVSFESLKCVMEAYFMLNTTRESGLYYSDLTTFESLSLDNSGNSNGSNSNSSSSEQREHSGSSINSNHSNNSGNGSDNNVQNINVQEDNKTNNNNNDNGDSKSKSNGDDDSGDCRLLTQAEWSIVIGQHLRRLNPKDWEALLRQLGSVVHFELFPRVWDWFASLTTCVAKVINIWNMNPPIIHGIMDRNEAASILAGQADKTWLVRLSLSNPGCLAVSFTINNGQTEPEVRHVLVSCIGPDFEIFITGGSVKYPTLEEFILKCIRLDRCVEYINQPKETLFEQEGPE